MIHLNTLRSMTGYNCMLSQAPSPPMFGLWHHHFGCVNPIEITPFDVPCLLVHSHSNPIESEFLRVKSHWNPMKSPCLPVYTTRNGHFLELLRWGNAAPWLSPGPSTNSPAAGDQCRKPTGDCKTYHPYKWWCKVRVYEMLALAIYHLAMTNIAMENHAF